MKKALIFGVTGQDGAYLSKFLLKKGYIVHGVKRRSSSLNSFRIDDIYSDPLVKKNKFFLHYGDITDSISVYNLVSTIKPNEVYNLAAQSHVAVSFEIPEYTTNADALGTLRILEAIKKVDKKIKFYQAGSSEMFGKVVEIPQTEKTPFYPRSPYGAAKVYSHWITINYRESYDLFACNGILFNHESPVRGETFVTRKITRAVSRIALGLQDKLYLGNLDAKRDWGHAKDYVRMMWMILQHNIPEDWVIATGRTTSTRDFVKMAFACVGVKLSFLGKGENEVAIVKSCSKTNYSIEIGKEVLSIDPKYFRPTEVDLLIGDSTKAKDKLGWVPEISLEELVDEMMQSDLKLFQRDKYLKEGGHETINYFE